MDSEKREPELVTNGLITKTKSGESSSKRQRDTSEEPFPNPADKQIKTGERKRLACSNCRRRRKKCDLNYPCSSCVRLRLQCNVNEEDLRKKRYSTGYVRSLETHVAYLETKLKELADKVFPNDQDALKSMMIGDIISDLGNEKSISSDVKLEVPDPVKGTPNDQERSRITTDSRPVSATPTGSNSSSPTTTTSENDVIQKKKFVNGSIYPEGPANYKPKKKETTIQRQQQRIADLKTTVIVRSMVQNAGSLNTDPSILKSLSNFYKWLYPGHFIFVHRESFLYGFFNHSEDNYEDSQYCSEELIYAMAAIGSRLTPTLQPLSEKYYQISKDKLLKIVFDEQSIAKITTVQALLCLAFYELGNGNNQLAWYFSGLAIRVGYDMGFQLDPKVWVTDESISNELSESELEIRSRIYWGCYIADHFICLLLGRASTLSVSNSTVPESDELPEIVGTEEFRFESKCVLQISLPLKNLIILSRIIQIFTAKIFIEPNSTLQRVEYLMKFNLKVYNWRQSLPDFLKWSKNLIKSTEISTDPTISYFWYHYYIVLLTFNKPFIQDCVESKMVVLEVLDDLKTLFSNFRGKFNGFKKSNLHQLYSCLLALTCLKKLDKMLPDEHISSVFPQLHTELQFFNNVFKQLYPSYELPKRMEEDTEFELEQEKQTYNQVSNLSYIHDFSLSDEIDDLIKQVFGFDHWNINPTHTL